MLNEIKNIYNEIQDLDTIFKEYKNVKTALRDCENEMSEIELKIESNEKQLIQQNIDKLEIEYINIINEIKKIDICSKECYKLSDIKIMLEYITDSEILMTKCKNFLSSLIYDIYITKDNLIKYFNPESYCNVKLDSKVYKIVKISNDLNDFFDVLKNENHSVIRNKCLHMSKMILEDELETILPGELLVYYDLTHFYIIFECFEDYDLNEDQYFSSVSFVNRDFLSNKKNLKNIFYEIFKNNLITRLLENSGKNNFLVDTNDFFKNTEYFITDINEWILDCLMKEIIIISKSKKSGKLVKINNERIASLTKQIDPKFLPEYISDELFRFLLCMNIYNTIESKRLPKALKIIERALFKMMNYEDTFIGFTDSTTILRIFPHMKILPQISVLREKYYCEIIKKSTELTISLQDSLMVLKVYFKSKYYDFLEQVKKFVPKNSQLSFEISFFNLLYTNITENIFCIKYLTNDKVSDMSDLLKYLLDLSFNIPKECIDIYPKFKSISTIFSSDLEDLISKQKSGTIFLSNEEIKLLVTLLFKESKTRNNFIRYLEL